MCLGVPGKVLSVAGQDPLFRTAKVDFGGLSREVSLACLPETQPGDYVIVHVGLAISRLDEEEAQRTLQDLAELRTLGQTGGPS